MKALASILSWQEAALRIKQARQRGHKIVSTNGCFDILHLGHVNYLAYARAQGDFLIVGINSDQSVRKLKGPDRPINSEHARATVLSQLRSVDAVCVFDEATPVEWLKSIQPDIHIKGGDYDIATMPETPVLKSWGGEVRLAPFVDGFSTSALIKKLKN